MRRKLVLLVLLLVLVAALAFPALAGRFYVQLVSKIMIMAIFAMSLGHAAFFGAGAYTLFLLSPEYGAASLWLSLPAAVAAAAVAALAIGLLVLRSAGVYFIMATLAFTQMFFYLATGSKTLG